MKKLFISQPMGGKTDEEIKAERAKAIESASELVGAVSYTHLTLPTNRMV